MVYSRTEHTPLLNGEPQPKAAAGVSSVLKYVAAACFVVVGIIAVTAQTGIPMPMLGESVEEIAESGTERARLFNACKASLPPPQLATDAIISEELKILFVDNVKAASSTVRYALSKVDLNWCSELAIRNSNNSTRVLDLSAIGDQSCLSCLSCPHSCQRLTTACLQKGALLNDFFKFSFVRDPVAKFESGVRQAWFQDEKLKPFTADELLDLQLSKQNFINEHLEPSSFRFNNVVGKQGETLLDFDFIGATETFEKDFTEVARRLETHHGVKEGMLEMAATTNQNVRKHDVRSKLSPAAVRKMCASALYGREWECFGYKKPAVCEGL